MKDKVKYILSDEKADIVCLRFDSADNAKEKLKSLLNRTKKPVMIIGTGDDAVDCELLPELLQIADRELIVGIVNENNYKSLIPPIAKGGHTAVIRTPIDINLAKEMNILSADLGLGLDKILIDTDIGGVGYGFEYGYSMMEKVKLEDDKFLNMPLISFAVEETAKTKESKENPKMALFLEITAAAGAKAAGAEYIYLNSVEALEALRGLE